MDTIAMQRALLDIEESTGPFLIQFAYSSGDHVGQLREMWCEKRNRNRGPGGKGAHHRSKFKYSLSANYLLLLQEIVLPKKPRQVPGLGTVHALEHNYRKLRQLDVSTARRNSKTVAAYSLRMYNNKLITL